MTTLATKKYYLKPLLSEEVNSDYLEWINNPELNAFLEAKYTNWTMDLLKKYVESFKGEKSKYIFAIYTAFDHKYIGNGTIYDVNRNVGTFNLGVFIGDRNYWSKKAGLEATFLLLNFGFDHLNMRKFFGGAYANQLASRFILKTLGMTQEATLKEKFKFEDKFVDQVIYSMTLEQWNKTKTHFAESSFLPPNKLANNEKSI